MLLGAYSNNIDKTLSVDSHRNANEPEEAAHL